jgi:hypothetical protein
MKIESVKEQDKFSWDETWFLEKLEFKSNMILEVYLVGGRREPMEELVVGNISLGQAYPIVRDESKRAVFRFIQPLTFQRLDESFAAEKGGTYTGQRYCIYSDSEYLRYFSKVTFGIVDEPIVHYSITCADDIIDVLSTAPPEIENGTSEVQVNVP